MNPGYNATTFLVCNRSRKGLKPAPVPQRENEYHEKANEARKDKDFVTTGMKQGQKIGSEKCVRVLYSLGIWADVNLIKILKC